MSLSSAVKIGFLVNPVAGMGGSVGLKGTDGKEVQAEAVRRGAVRVSPGRAVTALRSLKTQGMKLDVLSCTGSMGKEELDEAAISCEMVYEPSSFPTRDDTVAAASEFVRKGVAILVFAGGDGTARDVVEGTRDSVPIIGIPAGVKMHSAVFLNRPEDLGPLISSFARNPAIKSAEVMDIDEDLFRKGIVQAKLFGITSVPDDRIHVQTSKMAAYSESVQEEAKDIGQYIADSMEPDTLYIIGPGSTTESVGDALGIRKTLLGVDVVENGVLVKSDTSENDLLGLLHDGVRAKIVVSPIGAQGFFFGRGNQQISSRVISKVGKGNVIVIATPTKLRETPFLRTDTGDAATDEQLKGRIRVLTGYGRKRLVEVR